MGTKAAGDEEKPVLNQEEVDRELAGYRELAAQPARRQEAIDGLLAVEKKGKYEWLTSGQRRVGRQALAACKDAAFACMLAILPSRLYLVAQVACQRMWWPLARHAVQCWRCAAWSREGAAQ